MNLLKCVIAANAKVFSLAFLVVLLANTYSENLFFLKRNHGTVTVASESFTESSKELFNPNRGFYCIYGFTPSDGDVDLKKRVAQTVAIDNKSISLIEVNLRNYATGPISEVGMEKIKILFDELRKVNKQYIVRVLYDWDGKNMEREPKDINIIYNHMIQLEEIFREFSDIIFIHQGLFIGDCGEMHGTRYMDYIPQLALQLEAVTDEKTFLAVRTPAQWRTVTGMQWSTEEDRYKSSLVRRMGLFNDGICGNIYDYGTYGSNNKEQAGIYGKWTREEELEFQEELCKYVPNGGEVIVENPVNDFENVVRDFKTMHLTYLNRDYDRNVLEKWRSSIYTGSDCFNGMDGLHYIERHLGYRLFIAENEMNYHVGLDILGFSVGIRNVGFAPMYKEPQARITIRNKENGNKVFYTLETDLCSLPGGNETEKMFTITKYISLKNYLPGIYEVYVSFRDADSGYMIELANEQEPGEYGYLLGRIIIGEKVNE